MRSSEWALIQDDWDPYKKRKFGYRHEHTWSEDHVKTQGKDGHVQAKERGLRRNQPC